MIALAWANSPYAESYHALWETPINFTIGTFQVFPAEHATLHYFINDALMVLFFMLVGLELKREIVEGQLSRIDQIALPALAAVGGLAVPAAIYLFVTADTGPARNGWAIPTATDIAFALAVR